MSLPADILIAPAVCAHELFAPERDNLSFFFHHLSLSECRASAAPGARSGGDTGGRHLVALVQPRPVSQSSEGMRAIPVSQVPSDCRASGPMLRFARCASSCLRSTSPPMAGKCGSTHIRTAVRRTSRTATDSDRQAVRARKSRLAKKSNHRSTDQLEGLRFASSRCTRA